MPQDPLDWIDDALAEWDARHLRRQLRTRRGPQRAQIEVDGARLLNFASNDYLGLAADPRMLTPIAAAISQLGWGCGSSPLITGHSQAHAQLSAELAAFENAEGALLFGSGYAANVGTITSLVGPGDAIYSDAHNHASIIDGCRLSRADIHVYPHANAAALGKLLTNRGATYRRRLIVTDTVFSMQGDLAPLPQLVELAAQHRTMLMVDEAHATGVLGENGTGACEHFGVHDQVPIRVGTLSKALGSIGGFVVGRRSLMDWLVNHARSYIFATALPAAAAVAGSAALAIVQSEPQRRQQLVERADALRERLRGQGWQVGGGKSPIIPLFVGDPQPTRDMADRLRNAGILVPGIRPPSVPAGQCILRVSLSWLHTPAMIDQLVETLGSR